MAKHNPDKVNVLVEKSMSGDTRATPKIGEHGRPHLIRQPSFDSCNNLNAAELVEEPRTSPRTTSTKSSETEIPAEMLSTDDGIASGQQTRNFIIRPSASPMTAARCPTSRKCHCRDLLLAWAKMSEFIASVSRPREPTTNTVLASGHNDSIAEAKKCQCVIMRRSLRKTSNP